MKQHKKLKKELTFLDVFCLATGAMISSGLFVLPGIAHAKVGPALFIAYFISGLLALTGVFSQAELVSAMPKSGGAYFFVTRSLGPAVGTIQGILTWFSLLLKAAFALVGINAFVSLIFPQLTESLAFLPWPGLILGVFFVLLNLKGAKKAGSAQVYLVFFLLAALVIYMFYGFKAIDVQNYVPFMPYGFESIFIISGFIFVSYGGLLKVASVAEEVKNADRVIPRAMIVSLVVVSIFYSVVVFVTTGILGSAGLDGSLTPLSLGAKVTMGAWGVVLLSLAAIASFLTTANAGIMAASRYPLALSRDKLVPEILGRIHPKFQTPVISILVSGVVLLLCLFLKLDILIELASSVLILTFIFSHLSVLIMRESKVQNYQPTFRSPFYPWLQILSLLFFMFILFEMSREVFFVKIILIGVAFIIYWFYGRIRTEQKFALLHIIQRLTAKELVTGQLEEELKEIIQERDEIVKDKFDHIVEGCEVIDIEKKLMLEELCELIAQNVSQKIKCPTEKIELALLKRERESATTISNDIAIPHLIVEGKDVFNLILIRAKEGVYFDENHQDITAIFVLYGSKDKRSFHLRALSAIAQIVSASSFNKQWMLAKNEQALKDTIILSKRKRNINQK